MNDQLSAKELSILLQELDRVLSACIIGDVVELGCYKGLTSLELQRRINSSDKHLYIYDSFSGLPPKHIKDESPVGTQFVAGELPADKKEVISLFKKSGLKMPRIYKTWFKDIKEENLPHKISFAFLDGDFYDSILDSLKIIWSKMSSGSVVVVDDYANLALPGAAKAVDEWLSSHEAKLRVESSLAIIYPA